MNKERLLRLASHLDGLDTKGFNMDYWWKESHCGTVCCVLGPATTIPEFAEAGLRLSSDPPEVGKTVLFGDNEGFNAATAFFDLPSRRDALHLFDADHYYDDDSITPQEVAARIRAYVENDS